MTSFSAKARICQRETTRLRAGSPWIPISLAPPWLGSAAWNDAAPCTGREKRGVFSVTNGPEKGQSYRRIDAENKPGTPVVIQSGGGRKEGRRDERGRESRPMGRQAHRSRG